MNLPCNLVFCCATIIAPLTAIAQTQTTNGLESSVAPPEMTPDDFLLDLDHLHGGQDVRLRGFVLSDSVQEFFIYSSKSSTEGVPVLSSGLPRADRAKLLHCSLIRENCSVTVEGEIKREGVWADKIFWNPTNN